MPDPFWTDLRIGDLAAALVSPAWIDATRHLSAAVRLSADAPSALISIDEGRTTVSRATSESATVEITGPSTEWRRVASGDLDWFKATTPGFGGLVVRGDRGWVLRHIKIFWLIAKALGGDGEARSAPKPSPPPEPRHAPTIGRYVEVDGLDIYVEEAGEGPPILCLHAACQDTLMFRHVLSGLSDAYRVIAVDAPGHGKSELSPSGPFRDLTTHAAFSERLIETLALDRPAIVGCSMGGNEVLELAARRPGAYRAVISAEGADFTPGLDAFTLDMMLVNGAQLLECYAQSLTGRRTAADRARDVVWQIHRTTPEIIKADLGAYSGFDVRSRMGRITDPVLLIRGGDDWLVSEEQVTETACRIANARIVVLQGTGHYPMIENPVEFNWAVRDFLRTCDAS